MRLSLFTDTYGDVNGVSRFVGDVAAEAARRGRDLEVVTCTAKAPSGRPSPNVRNYGARLSRPYRRYPDLEYVVPPAWSMLRDTYRRDPDIIHVSTPGPVGLVGLLAAAVLDKPLTGVYHTDFPAYIRNLYGTSIMEKMALGYMRAFYRVFEVVFARSSQYMDVLSHMGFPRDTLRELTPGLDIDTFHPRHRREGFWRAYGLDDRPKVLYTGRLSVEKNIPFLVEAWESFCQTGPPADLVVVGDGPYRKTMQESLPDAVYLGCRTGHELAAVYANADVFVFPSRTDTLGQVVMEAQASGLPALVSDEGGPQWTVQDGRTGHVLPARDPHAWAEVLDTWVRDPALRQRLGRQAHAMMQSRSFTASFDAWWDLQREAWHRRNARWCDMVGPAVPDTPVQVPA